MEVVGVEIIEEKFIVVGFYLLSLCKEHGFHIEGMDVETTKAYWN